MSVRTIATYSTFVVVTIENNIAFYKFDFRYINTACEI